MSIEKMKLAIEALESAEPKYTRQRADQRTLGGSLEYWKLEQHQRMNAITALRQAIEQAQKQEPCRHRIADITNEAVKSGYMCMDCGALFGAYTSPPQRQPLTITEESAWDLARYVYSRSNPHESPQILLSAMEIKQIIEAAHGIGEKE